MQFLLVLVLGVLALCKARPALAARVAFESCVSTEIKRSGTYFVPTTVDAIYYPDEEYVNISVVGNMYGSLPDYSDTTNRLTTLRTSSKILQFSRDTDYIRFCDVVASDECPFGPLDGASFHSQFSLPSSYYFLTVNSELAVIDPTESADIVACVRSNITPKFSSSLMNVLIFVPAGILCLVAISIVFSSMYNPWSGTKDFFSWSSNFGQDPDTLRLITPGFGDLLQYLQFSFFLGSLNLSFPGFYQPAISSAAWSTLLFSSTFASRTGGEYDKDNIYSTDGRYGLSNLSQLAGQGEDYDSWTCFIVWLLVLTIVLMAIIQSTFFTKWLIYRITSRHPVDLRSKNGPFSAGMLIRIWINFFSLPLVTFSTFQLLISPYSPVYISVLAGLLLLLWIVGSVFLLTVIRRTRPQQALYDDLPTLLWLGPLYNSYTEHAFLFCIVQIFFTFLRGVFFGVLQCSGTAQLTLLALTEVIYFLLLVIAHPYNKVSRMNIYQCILSIVRLVCIMFSVVFVPALSVSATISGWFAYAILLIHALVLIFIFFIHSIQAVLEVVAYLMGFSGESSSTFVRALGLRQLARRRQIREKTLRDLRISDVPQSLVFHREFDSGYFEPPKTVDSPQNLDTTTLPTSTTIVSTGQRSAGPYSPGSGNADSPVSPHTYYRAPRRNKTFRINSDDSTDVSPKTAGISSEAVTPTILDGSQTNQVRSGELTTEEETDSELWSSLMFPSKQKKVDYAVREADVYYHSRARTFKDFDSDSGYPGSATLTNDASASSSSYGNPAATSEAKLREPLSESGTIRSRRLGTGPADPNSVGSGVLGWFSRRVDDTAQRLHLGNRHKGFVVVRNSPLQVAEDSQGIELRSTNATVYSSDQPVSRDHPVQEGGSSTNKLPLAGSSLPRKSISRNSKDLTIVVNHSVPKNTFTPIIRSPVPPALRRQQQGKEVLPISTEPPGMVFESEPANHSTSLASISPTDQSQLLTETSLNVNSGAVRSNRVGDMIMNSELLTGLQSIQPQQLEFDD
ncbi:uncharacterized protein V1516DRAFT_671835 [Lipomyces oligophaga]|uniref:uncharacterized protein n=1 Tax=Lipomyces oligophaga TaxID=45792 RepID=UPI0034CF69FF